MKRGTAAWTRNEISRTISRLKELESWQDRLKQARQALLLAGDDRDRPMISEIVDGRPRDGGAWIVSRNADAQRNLDGWDGRGLRSIETEIADQQERLELLEAQLPSPEELAAVGARFAELAKEAIGSGESFEKSWSVFTVALAEVEAAARQVVADRTQAEAPFGEMLELRDSYGLDAALPHQPKPDPGETKLAGMLALVYQQVSRIQKIAPERDSALATARREIAEKAA